jgi:hypothetical protein
MPPARFRMSKAEGERLEKIVDREYKKLQDKKLDPITPEELRIQPGDRALGIETFRQKLIIADEIIGNPSKRVRAQDYYDRSDVDGLRTSKWVSSRRWPAGRLEDILLRRPSRRAAR